MTFCTKCGADMAGRKNFCGKCGMAAITQSVITAPIARTVQPKVMLQTPPSRAIVLLGQKSSGLAAVLSFLWAGLGQIYTGQIAKGIILMIVYPILVWIGIGSVVLGGLVAFGSSDADGTAAGSGVALLGVLALIGSAALWVYGMVNAYRTAERLNREQLAAL